MVCYNVNIILAHDPIFQLDVCSILLKHPSRGQRQCIFAGFGHSISDGEKHPSRGQRQCIIADYCEIEPATAGKHPSRGQRQCIIKQQNCNRSGSETPLTGTATVHYQLRQHYGFHHRRNTPHGAVQHISSCALPIFAARHGGRLQKTERGAKHASLFRPLDALRRVCLSRGHIFPLPSSWGRAFLCPKTNSPGLEAGAVFGCAENFFKKWRNLFNPAPPAIL